MTVQKLITQRFDIEQWPMGRALVLKQACIPDGAPLRFLQITDCHLGATVGERLVGMDTDESLNHVIELIKQRLASQDEVDLLLATGDLANHASAAAYTRLLDKISELHLPSVWLPGNHDDYQLMVDTVGAETVPKMVVLGSWHLILLDSVVAGRVGGRIGDDQLALLGEQLKAIDASANIIVALHHQPLAIGSDWIDTQRVEDGEALVDTLAGDERIKAVIWGHVHQEFETRVPKMGSTRFMSAPSTCIQFAPQQKDFKVHDRSPGYRWFELAEDGTLSTGVERLQGVELQQDLQSKGY